MSSIFTKIINGDIPASFVYTDEQCVAFLDVSPKNYGHTLVVPVQEVDKWTELDPELWSHLNAVAQRIGQAQIAAFDCPRAGYVIAGFEVPHTHIHVFPAYSMDDFTKPSMESGQVDKSQMEDAAEKIRLALAQQEEATQNS